MKHSHSTGIAIGRGRQRWEPPKYSYWATPGITRAELAMIVQERRAHHQLPSEGELHHDPAMSATLSLRAHKVEVRKRSARA